MTQMLYIANARLPTEKAHGLQIAQMCEAFSHAGFEIKLVVPSRKTRSSPQSQNVWSYYGIERNFEIEQLWTIDLVRAFPKFLKSFAFYLQRATFEWSVLWWLRNQSASRPVYSRDWSLLWWLTWLYPNRLIIYEAHNASPSRLGGWLQARVIRKVNAVIAVTGYLAKLLEMKGRRSVAVEHDGIRTGRFAHIPSMTDARQKLGINLHSFVACYLGRLDTMGMDKGVGTLVEAFAQCFEERPAWTGELLIVGGKQVALDALRQRWAALGMPDTALYSTGEIPAMEVPSYLAASDVCVMPHPWTEFFAFYTSPLKLFEYMAAGRAILATDMPVFREVLVEGENVLFVPPSNPPAMARALFTLADYPRLREEIGKNNQKAVQYYTWQARAARIKRVIDDLILQAHSFV